MSTHRLLCVLVALGAPATAALAGDLNAPAPGNALAPWTRGSAGTTMNSWLFLSSGAITPNTSSSNPSIAAGSLSTTGTAAWFGETPDAGRGAGVWELEPNEFIQFTIPNFSNTNFKYIYTQIRYYNGQPSVLVRDPDQGTLGDLFASGTPFGASGASNWQVTYSLPYTPDSEQVRIFNTNAFPIYIDQVVIDTYSTPAPGTGLAVLALSAAGARRRRR
jgi:hypothetical protein